MTHKKLLCTGATGSVIAAICCFTPVLVVLFGAVGLSAWLGWIDYVLFPALAIFLGITAYALYIGKRRPAAPESHVSTSRGSSEAERPPATAKFPNGRNSGPSSGSENIAHFTKIFVSRTQDAYRAPLQ